MLGLLELQTGGGFSTAFLCQSDVDEFEFKSRELRVAFCLQTVRDVDQRSFVQCHFSAADWPVDATAPAECAEPESFSGFFELEADVFLFDEPDWRCER
jgi:hypothetical protein